MEKLNHGRPDGDENQGGHDEEHERDDHLDGGFRGLFFGALATFGAERVGMHTQSLGDAGTEAIGLNESSDEGADVIDSGAFGEIAESLDAGLTGSGFEIEKMKFGAEFGMGVTEVLADAHHGLIERETGFDADDGKVESIGKAETDATLAFLQFLFQKETGKKEAEGGEADQEHRRIESGEKENGNETEGGEEHARSAIDGDVLGVAISRLDEPKAGLGDFGGRNGQGAAQRIESLLHAFANGGSCGSLGALPSDFSEAGAKDGGRSDRGRAKREDDDRDG